MITEEDIREFVEEIESSRRPPLTVPQMVEIFAETMRQEKNPEMSLKLVFEEFSEFWEEADEEHRNYKPLNREKVLKEMADLVYVLYGYARSLDLPLDEAVRRVHKNNIDRCVWPDGGVKYRADGKVLKRDNPPKIDLGDLV